MKKVFVAGFFLIATLLMSGLAVSDANAQVPTSRPMEISVGAGFGVPSGDLGDSHKIGFHGTGRAAFSVAPKLDVWVGADYNTFPSDVSGISGGSFSTFNLVGDLKLNLGAPGMSAQPFVLGGVGAALSKIGSTTGGASPTPSVSETNLFAEFGGGAEFNKFFAMARYVMIFADGSTLSYIPVTVGVKF